MIALGVASTLGTDLIPQLAQDRFEMTAKLPPGTQLRETDALVRAVQTAELVVAAMGVGGEVVAEPGLAPESDVRPVAAIRANDSSALA